MTNTDKPEFNLWRLCLAMGPVFMAVANDVGFDVRQNKEVITGVNDLIRILEAYRSGPQAPAGA